VLDMSALAGIYEGLALSLRQTGQYHRALAYAQKGLRLFETLNDVRMTAQLRLNMGDMLLQQGRVTEADRLFSEGAEHLRRIGDHELLPHLVVGMAESALEFKDLERARDLIQQAIDLATRSSDPLSASLRGGPGPGASCRHVKSTWRIGRPHLTRVDATSHNDDHGRWFRSRRTIPPPPSAPNTQKVWLASHRAIDWSHTVKGD